ncbi:LOW QUALITY PROTEIN: hypothetical protein TorRG33x02_111870 [Trema orientale]|uniref:Uncharacterized protein n=1 Tax=Trema orientale TaxID=63057 RepID=A0A2P5F537_TREOI|nr:LOW QUALITY PROTEIN: hypothetical protein TorRG33x02_111870 [Trema orientale]
MRLQFLKDSTLVVRRCFWSKTADLIENLPFLAATQPQVSAGLLKERGICMIILTSSSEKAALSLRKFHCDPWHIKSLTQALPGPGSQVGVGLKVGCFGTQGSIQIFVVVPSPIKRQAPL